MAGFLNEFVLVLVSEGLAKKCKQTRGRGLYYFLEQGLGEFLSPLFLGQVVFVELGEIVGLFFDQEFQIKESLSKIVIKFRLFLKVFEHKCFGEVLLAYFDEFFDDLVI